MESEMGHPTAPHDVTPHQKLHRGNDGWSGKGWIADVEIWRVVNNVIKIKSSDADHNRVPSVEQRKRTVDNEGNFSHWVLLGEDDSLYQLWMRKIGPYLADWVLGKSRYGSPEWKLLRFPEGYSLWLHKTGVETDPANPRMDAYLFGAPHLSPPTTAARAFSAPHAPTVFRSPMEFVEHAIWLMRRGVGPPCLCKYCIPGQNQLDINLRLLHGDPEDEDGDVIVVDDDGDGAGAGSGSSGGAGAGGRGTRGRRGRRAKRDRSPPIMAKDYRVGITPSDPAPGPA